jgi:hypothetical protein
MRQNAMKHLIAEGLHDHAPPALIVGDEGLPFDAPLICILSTIHTP